MSKAKPAFTLSLSLLIPLFGSFIFPLSSFAQNNTSEEIMTFETYYPAPFGVYNEMRSKKMAIGDTYYNGSQYCWSGTCSNPINATTNLVVEGNVGIGTVAVSALEPTTRLKVESNHSLGGNTVEILNRGGGDVGMGFFDANNTARGNIAYVTSLGPPRFAINQQFSGWNAPLTNTTINEGGGSVGIGTTAATTAPDGGAYGAPKVDIRGQLFLTSNVDNYIGLYLSRSGGPTSGWNSPGGTWGVYRYGSGAADRFCIGLTGVNEPFCILPNGNVGIGTTASAGALHVARYGIYNSNSEAPLIVSSNWPDLDKRIDIGFDKGGPNAGYIQAKEVTGTGSGDYAVRALVLNPSGGNVGIGPIAGFTPSSALHVFGTFTATGSKNFEIDHPTKPGYKLIHSALEGPEVAVFYRGQSRLKDGRAVVQLPDYFEALTRKESRTVQLTPKGKLPYLLSAAEVVDGEFVVYGTNPQGEFYWEVKAVRADIEPLMVEKPNAQQP